MTHYTIQDADEPPKRVVTRATRERPRKFPFHDMSVGKMFFAPGAKPTTMMSLACATGKRLGFTFQTRRQIMRLDPVTQQWMPCAIDDEGATPGVGVYRTK